MTCSAPGICLFQNAARASLSLFTQALVFWRIYDLHVEILPRNGREKNKRKAQLLAFSTTGEKKKFFPLHSVILTIVLSISLVLRSAFLATVSFGSWSNGLCLDRHFV